MDREEDDEELRHARVMLEGIHKEDQDVLIIRPVESVLEKKDKWIGGEAYLIAFCKEDIFKFPNLFP